MKNISIFHFLIGILLTGCTYNNTFTSTSDNDSYVFADKDPYQLQEIYKPEKTVIEEKTGIEQKPEKEKEKEKEKISCTSYKPLVLPKPHKVNLEQVKKAANDYEVNKLLLENIALLNKQIVSNAKLQENHFKKWLKQCVDTKK